MIVWLGVSIGSISWASTAAAEATGGPVVLPEPMPPSRHVILETIGRNASLERNEPVQGEFGWHLVWRPICESPCSVDVPSTGLYRVSGPGVRSSRTFRLSGERGPIHVQANPGSAAGWGWGLASMIVAGSVFLPTTIILLADQRSCDQAPDPDCHRVLTQAGLFTLALTVVSGAGGLYLLLSNKTDLTLTSASRPLGRRPSLWGLSLSLEGVTF